MNTEELPKTLHETAVYFATGDNALKFMIELRWPDGVAQCPRCACRETRFLATRSVWECKGCRKQFSVKVGTVFEDSPIKLDKWVCAIWLIANAKNGISSYELHRSLGITQKSAWFMLHRLRFAMHDGCFEKMSGHIEADETFIGAKARNMHAGKRREAVKGRGPVAMTAVMGLLERNTGHPAKKASRVRLHVVSSRKKPELQGKVRDYVLKGSEVHTDALKSYDGLAPDYVHKVVDHAECYVKDNVHTNGLENFWSLLKRTIKGTYVCPAPFHLFRYLDEQAFRFNERKDDDQGRFLKAIKGIVGKRLLYRHLIAQDGADGLPALA